MLAAEIASHSSASWPLRDRCRIDALSLLHAHSLPHALCTALSLLHALCTALRRLHALTRALCCRWQAEVVPEFVQQRRHEVLQATMQVERSWNQGLLRNLMQHLEKMAVGPVHVGATTPDGLIHVDALLPGLRCEGKPVALELIDAMHVTDTGQPLGRFLLRRRLLQAQGFHVLAIAEDAWLASADPDGMLGVLLAECERSVHVSRSLYSKSGLETVQHVYYDNPRSMQGHRSISTLDGRVLEGSQGAAP
jgi:hypothetical protein